MRLLPFRQWSRSRGSRQRFHDPVLLANVAGQSSLTSERMYRLSTSAAVINKKNGRRVLNDAETSGRQAVAWPTRTVGARGRLADRAGNLWSSRTGFAKLELRGTSVLGGCE
jgi:hypothetical protein